MDADDVRSEEVRRLAEHGGLGLDAAHAVGDDAQAVDHRRVRVGADERIRIVDAAALVDAGREVLEVDLVHDSQPGRHDLQPVERAHSPLEELVPGAIARELDAHVELERVRHFGEVHLHRVIDHQVDRHQRLDQARRLRRLLHGAPHRREIDHQGNAGEVLQEHAGDHEGDLLRPLRLRLPRCEGADVRLADALAVQVPQQRLEDDAQADRQPGDLAEALSLHFGQRIEGSVAESLFEVHGGAHIGDLIGLCYSRTNRGPNRGGLTRRRPRSVVAPPPREA